jgi:hypothetical protein
MKNVQDRLVWYFLAVWAAVCVLLIFVCASMAHAQIGGEVFSERSSSRPHGKYIVGYNATGTEIQDGTLVMADTTGSTSQPQIALGKGFKTWTHVTTFGHAQRVLGVLMGNVPGYSQGRILVLGFHPWVKVDASAITAFSLMRPSTSTATNGAMGQFAASDTTAAGLRKPVIGIFQRYANPDSLRAYVWVNTTGALSP